MMKWMITIGMLVACMTLWAVCIMYGELDSVFQGLGDIVFDVS